MSRQYVSYRTNEPVCGAQSYVIDGIIPAMHIGMIEPPAANRAVGSEQVGAARPEVRLDTSLELLLERAPVTQIARVPATVVATPGPTARKPGAPPLIRAAAKPF